MQALVKTRRRKRLVIFLSIFCAVFLWRYILMGGFGLYEDDFTRIPAAMGMDLEELWTTTLSLFRILGGNGRPFHDILINLFSGTIGKLGGIRGLYLLGLIIFSLNSALFYGLLERISTPITAVIGTLAFILFPADTTQIYLTSSLGIQPSITAILIAFHLFLKGHHFWAYVAACFSLFCYETLYPLFVFAPLLELRFGRQDRRKAIGHIGILLGLMFFAVLARVLIGEIRVVGLGFPEVVKVPLLHMLQGPAVSLGAFILRPYQLLISRENQPLMVGILSVLAIGSLLKFLPGLSLIEQGDPKVKSFFTGSGLVIRLRDDQLRSLKRMAIGALMLAFAYPLTFTVRAYAITGRDTRVHVAAVVGAAFLVGSFASLLFETIRKPVARTCLIGVISIGLGLNAGYAHSIQMDYASSWNEQRQFWGSVINLCPDIEDGTVILILPHDQIEKRQISSYSWNLPRIFGQLFDFPDSWSAPPRVYQLTELWESSLDTSDGSLSLNGVTTSAPHSLYRQIVLEDAIILQVEDGIWSRSRNPIRIGEVEIPVRAGGENILQEYRTTILYQIMFGGKNL